MKSTTPTWVMFWLRFSNSTQNGSASGSREVGARAGLLEHAVERDRAVVGPTGAGWRRGGRDQRSRTAGRATPSYAAPAPTGAYGRQPYRVRVVDGGEEEELPSELSRRELHRSGRRRLGRRAGAARRSRWPSASSPPSRPWPPCRSTTPPSRRSPTRSSPAARRRSPTSATRSTRRRSPASTPSRAPSRPTCCASTTTR